MKRKLIIVIYVILILIALKFTYNQVINSILIDKYNKNDYKENYAKALLFLLIFTEIFFINAKNMKKL